MHKLKCELQITQTMELLVFQESTAIATTEKQNKSSNQWLHFMSSIEDGTEWDNVVPRFFL